MKFKRPGSTKMKFRYKSIRNLWIRYLLCSWRIHFRRRVLIRIKERMVFQALGHIRMKETVPDGYVMEYLNQQIGCLPGFTIKMYDGLFAWWIDLKIKTADFYYEPDERHDSKQPG